MEHFRLDFWGLLLHLLGILLWCMTIIYLIKDRLDRNRTSTRYDPQNDLKDFGDEMGFQLIKQQAEMTLETLSTTIDRERSVLHKLIEKRRMEEKNGGFLRQKTKLPQNRPSEKKENTAPAPVSHVEKDPYDDVVRLSALGFSEKEISERVRLPKSEITLIRRLNVYGGKPVNGSAPRVGAVSQQCSEWNVSEKSSAGFKQ